MVLHLSLTLKIPVRGQQLSRASGTRTDNYDFMALKFCVIATERDTVGLNSAKTFLRRWSTCLKIDKVLNVFII